ncbi:MAG: ribonuclease P protein component [Alphaproteobacteria bacterium]|nr:ribonuclease P protein component [Alphaproteobacteria bacterium]
MAGTAVETTPKAEQCDVSPVTRLPRRADFLRVAAERRRWAAPGLVLQVAPRPEPESGAETGVRVGFTATKKIGNAVTRNRARRRLRAAVREIIPRAARPDCDYVVIARGATGTRAYPKLLADLRIALEKCDALRPCAAGEAP